MDSILIAAATDLKKKIFTVDFAHSFRADTGALSAAPSSVESGTEKKYVASHWDYRNRPKTDIRLRGRR